MISQRPPGIEALRHHLAQREARSVENGRLERRGPNTERSFLADAGFIDRCHGQTVHGQTVMGPISGVTGVVTSRVADAAHGLDQQWIGPGSRSILRAQAVDLHPSTAPASPIEPPLPANASRGHGFRQAWPRGTRSIFAFRGR